MKALFLPAVLPTTLTDRWGTRPLNWLDPRVKGAPSYYPHLLQSFYHWTSSRLHIPRDGYRFGDSGGYTIATQGVLIDPREVLLWQIEHSTGGAILDHPPGSIAGVMDGTPWEDALILTANNVRRGLPIYLRVRENGSPFRLWGVAHGENQSQLEGWHRRISDLYPFTGPGEGWAVKPFPSNNPGGVVRCLRFLRSQGIRRAHFFRTAGVRSVVILYCLGPQAGLEFLTYDATSPITTGNNRGLFIPKPDLLGWETLAEKRRITGETPARTYMKEVCECVSCQWLREDLEDDPDLEDEYFKYRFIFHNVLTVLKVFDNLYEVSLQDPRALLREKLGRSFPTNL